jgi:hypothetical protein
MKQIWLFVVAALFALTTTVAFAGQPMPTASGMGMEESKGSGMSTKMESTTTEGGKMEGKKMDGDAMKVEGKKGAMDSKMEGTTMESKPMAGDAMKTEGKK